MKKYNTITKTSLSTSIIYKTKKGLEVILNDIKKEHKSILKLLFISVFFTLAYKILLAIPSWINWNIEKKIYQFYLVVPLLFSYVFTQKKITCLDNEYTHTSIKIFLNTIKQEIIKEKNLFNKILTIILTVISCLITVIFISIPLLYLIYGIINRELTAIVLHNVFYLVAVAICEEMTFRGLLISLFFSQCSKRIMSLNFWSIFITSIMFGLAHLPKASIGAIANIILMGLILSSIFILTRKIILSIIFHFEWDVLMTVKDAPNTDLTDAATNINSGTSISIIVLIIIFSLLTYWIYKTGANKL